MREWLSGRASPCQGEGRGFKSRLPLYKRLMDRAESHQPFYSATSPSGKARVCKTLMRGFKSRRRLSMKKALVFRGFSLSSSLSERQALLQFWSKIGVEWAIDLGQ